MGIGFATGEDRAKQAAERALRSPLIDTEIVGARGILLSIAGGDDLTLLEVNDAAEVDPPGRDRRHEHHLRRDRRRAARGPGLGDRRRDGHRRRPARRSAVRRTREHDRRRARRRAARAAELPPHARPRRLRGSRRPGRARSRRTPRRARGNRSPRRQRSPTAGRWRRIGSDRAGEVEHAAGAEGDARRSSRPRRRRFRPRARRRRRSPWALSAKAAAALATPMFPGVNGSVPGELECRHDQHRGEQRVLDAERRRDRGRRCDAADRREPDPAESWPARADSGRRRGRRRGGARCDPAAASCVRGTQSRSQRARRARRFRSGRPAARRWRRRSVSIAASQTQCADSDRRADPAGRPDPSFAVQHAGEERDAEGRAELGGRERVDAASRRRSAQRRRAATSRRRSGRARSARRRPSRPARRRTAGAAIQSQARFASPSPSIRCAPGRRADVASSRRRRPPRATRRRRRYVSCGRCACWMFDQESCPVVGKNRKALSGLPIRLR